MTPTEMREKAAAYLGNPENQARIRAVQAVAQAVARDMREKSRPKPEDRTRVYGPSPIKRLPRRA